MVNRTRLKSSTSVYYTFFVADIAFSTNLLVKNAHYALVYHTNYRFPSEKYTVGKNLSLVENTRYPKVISVNYNQWKIHDGN